MHDHAKVQIDLKGKPKLVLVGNPNVGKSVVFNHLTGRYVTVSNYPGTTVDLSEGLGRFDGQTFEVIDTPGTNSLLARSEDERVTRDVLIRERPRAVIQVADAKNLRRSLLLTLEIAEMDLPLVLNLNMSDEALDRGIKINRRRLGQILGVEVVPTVATTGEGIASLKGAAVLARPSSVRVLYDPPVEEALQKISTLLPPETQGKHSVSAMLLVGDETAWRIVDALTEGRKARIREIVNEVQGRYALPMSVVVWGEKQKKVQSIVEEVVSTSRSLAPSMADTIGQAAMRPWPGVPLALLVVLIMYFFVGRLAAGNVVNFLETIVFGHLLNPFFTRLVRWVLPVPFLRDMLIGPYGLLTMALTYALAIIFPIVTAFFLFFGILEDSGYLPRLAVMADRVFCVMGLNGKAVLPMVLGLGCDTMATLTSRILDTKKERIIVTLLLALGVPCSAQLGVILGMLGGLSASAALIWLGVVTLVLVAVGYLASKLIPGGRSCFIQEIPPIRLPVLSNILVKIMVRLEWYLKEAVPLFMLGTFLLFLGDRYGALKRIEQAATPLVVNFLGLPAKATEAFLVGFLRRDYGAAGLYLLAKEGLLDHIQIVVSLVTITLFIPCIAQLMVMMKERGWKVATGITVLVFALAFLVGGCLNLVLRALRLAI